MPSLENWQKEPLTIIRDIFDKKTSGGWSRQVEEYFRAHLNDSAKYASIPSLNDRPLHELQPHSLVRFRCMVQDTYDNEYFLQTYHEIDKKSGAEALRTSCYQDVISCPKNCEINMDHKRNETGMRQILYCVSVPGETDWVKEAWKSLSVIKPNSDKIGSGDSSKKRTREEEDEDDSVTMHTEGGTESVVKKKPTAAGDDRVHGAQPQANGGACTSASVDKNHPLPGETGPVCLVKVYDESAEFKVNEILEVVGVLSVDPALSATYDEHDKQGQSSMDTSDAEEQRAHHPPASLVPRLHAVTTRKLQHLNPHLPPELTNETILRSLNNEASSIRTSLLGILTKALLGDAVTAEYLLLHLLARVYTRRDMLPLGKFSLNISGFPVNSRYPQILSQFLQELMTKMYYLPMTLENINNQRFAPMKNYSTNRLESGILQLPYGTCLVLDETKLEAGTMEAGGVKNVQILKNAIAFQKVDYNFQFHEASFECDIGFLVLSEGKSLLPCDCQVGLRPQSDIPHSLEEYFRSICADVPVSFLQKSREYIGCVKLLDYEMTDQMTKVIQDDFVAARQEDARKVTADDLHVWLILARLLSLSVGQQTLNPARWERVKALEVQRKERLLNSSFSPP